MSEQADLRVQNTSTPAIVCEPVTTFWKQLSETAQNQLLDLIVWAEIESAGVGVERDEKCKEIRNRITHGLDDYRVGSSYLSTLIKKIGPKLKPVWDAQREKSRQEIGKYELHDCLMLFVIRLLALYREHVYQHDKSKEFLEEIENRLKNGRIPVETLVKLVEKSVPERADDFSVQKYGNRLRNRLAYDKEFPAQDVIPRINELLDGPISKESLKEKVKALVQNRDISKILEEVSEKMDHLGQFLHCLHSALFKVRKNGGYKTICQNMDKILNNCPRLLDLGEILAPEDEKLDGHNGRDICSEKLVSLPDVGQLYEPCMKILRKHYHSENQPTENSDGK